MGVNGYGIVYLDGREQRAHRVAYAAAHGPIPPGLEVRHRCDRPPCVRLDHLELGTHAQNMAEAVVRGRIATGLRNGRAKLTDDQVADVRARRAAGQTCQQVADHYGVTTGYVSRVARGLRRG